MQWWLTKLDAFTGLNEPWEWLAAFAIAMVVYVAASVVRRWVRARYRRLAETERVELTEVPLEIASKTATSFLLLVSMYCGLRALTLPPRVESVATTVVTMVSFWQIGVWGSAAVLAWLVVRRRKTVEHDRAAASSLGIIGVVVRGLVWALVLLLTLDNLGVDITALVAGLGVGGIAVALAVQNVLGDLFASLEQQERTRFDRCHFAKFGPSSLDFEVVYYMLSADFNAHMDVQQAIYFAIHAAFEETKVEFAYPTQKLWLSGPGGAEARTAVARGMNGATKAPGSA